MQKTRDVLVLYDMCSCLENVDNKGWYCCRYIYSCIIFHCIAWWGSTATIAPINVLESDWLLEISFPKDISRGESGTTFWGALLFSFCTSYVQRLCCTELKMFYHCWWSLLGKFLTRELGSFFFSASEVLTWAVLTKPSSFITGSLCLMFSKMRSKSSKDYLF